MKPIRKIVVSILMIAAYSVALPLAFVADTISGTRDYTFRSMFADIHDHLKEIWKD